MDLSTVDGTGGTPGDTCTWKGTENLAKPSTWGGMVGWKVSHTAGSGSWRYSRVELSDGETKDIADVTLWARSSGAWIDPPQLPPLRNLVTTRTMTQTHTLTKSTDCECAGDDSKTISFTQVLKVKAPNTILPGTTITFTP